ncbi:MAG TPA: dTDP-4-dehydrorhamnose 3,5-epimerase [Candidatus Dormibacteraeota bacterium]
MEYRVTPTELPGVVVIDTDFFRDERGFFIEAWHRQRFAALGLDFEVVQDNHSRSGRGVLRGIHWQDWSAPLGKLVRCTAGAIFDVAVDLRVGSPSFGRWTSVELSAANMRQVWVPPGFGHAFLALAEGSEVQYKCTGYYTPSAEGCLRWDDAEVGIEWPQREVIVSAKDAGGMSLAEYRARPAFPEGWEERARGRR